MGTRSYHLERLEQQTFTCWYTTGGEPDADSDVDAAASVDAGADEDADAAASDVSCWISRFRPVSFLYHECPQHSACRIIRHPPLLDYGTWRTRPRRLTSSNLWSVFARGHCHHHPVAPVCVCHDFRSSSEFVSHYRAGLTSRDLRAGNGPWCLTCEWNASRKYLRQRHCYLAYHSSMFRKGISCLLFSFFSLLRHGSQCISFKQTDQVSFENHRRRMESRTE